MKRRHIVLFVAAAIACPVLVSAAASKLIEPPQAAASQTNRRAALRCLALAKASAGTGNWGAASAQASLGLTYDGSISDLWYLLAVADLRQDKPKAEIGAYVRNALEAGRWTDYNRDAARVLYADILSDTRDCAAVFAVLDGAASGGADAFPYPYIYSADAEYVRAKAYYRLGTPQARSLARDKVDYARRMYPRDGRFALLFFTYELPEQADGGAESLAAYFISHLGLYEESMSDAAVLAELEVRAARFAHEPERESILRSCNAKGWRHPLYASLALGQSLLTEKAALDYILSFADEQIDYAVLRDFLPLLTRQSVRQQASAYFAAYSGVIVRDTDGDGIEDLYVKYSRGRAQTVFYDENQDGVLDWTVACDFGVPVAATVAASRMDVAWEAFPAVESVALRDADNSVVQTFGLVSGEFTWAPLLMERDAFLSAGMGIDFFFPQLTQPVAAEEGAYTADAHTSAIALEKLLAAAYSITIPTQERPDASITFSLLDGIIQLATYKQGETVYAQAQFVGGEPSLRVVDVDGDGVFETTEFYAVDDTGAMAVHSLEDERAVMINLMGVPSSGGHYYLRMVQVDSASDSVPDYTEEYLPYGGKISSWDTDGDGLWDVRYVRHSQLPGREDGDSAVEESLFRDLSGELVTVTGRNGRLVSVQRGDDVLPVTADAAYKFYWVGEAGDSDMVKSVLRALDQSQNQGTRVMVDTGDGRCVMGIRVGEFSYGTIIAKEDGADEHTENNSSADN